MVAVNSDGRLDCVSLHRDGNSEIRTTKKVKTKRDGATRVASQNILVMLDVEPTISQHESTKMMRTVLTSMTKRSRDRRQKTGKMIKATLS